MKTLRFKGIEMPFDQFCLQCDNERRRPHSSWSEIDLRIWHDNGHVWPGFVGEPDGNDYGGSDF